MKLHPAHGAASALLVSAFLGCGVIDGAAAEQSPSELADRGSAGAAEDTDVAPGKLVIAGAYSDSRFIAMMAAHHQMAIDMSRLALDRAEHKELRDLARKTIDEQTREVDELEDMRRNTERRAPLPRMMNPEQVENMGLVSMQELKNAASFDLAFIDSMLPHHAGAIEMASVAQLRSSDRRLQELARGIIDSQAKDIGRLIAWRNDWYRKAP
jgi:uncharacterized protein (DUF305 family)